MNHVRFVCVLAALASGSLAAADEYQFIPVEAPSTFGIPECYLRDINNAGLAVGTSTATTQDPQGNYHTGYAPVVWSPTTGLAVQDGPSYLIAVSDNGWVAGSGVVKHLPTGQTFNPPTLPGTFGAPFLMGVNSSGTAVGSIQTCVCSNSQQLQQVAYVWDPIGGARSINVAGAKELVKINDAGIAVGNIRASGGVGDGFVYDINTGESTLLSSVIPAPPPGIVYKVVAVDINQSGMVTGYFRENTTGHNTGFTWSASGGVTLLLPPAGASYTHDVRPSSISDAGAVVGTIGYTEGGARPFVYDVSHGVRDLATLTTPTISFTYWIASAVNSQGIITAYGLKSSGFASVVLVPITSCFANCDGSTTIPTLSANDFQCFLNHFAAGDPYANCDQSTASPTLTANDFQCFLNAFAAGCP